MAVICGLSGARIHNTHYATNIINDINGLAFWPVIWRAIDRHGCALTHGKPQDLRNAKGGMAWGYPAVFVRAAGDRVVTDPQFLFFKFFLKERLTSMRQTLTRSQRDTLRVLEQQHG